MLLDLDYVLSVFLIARCSASLICPNLVSRFRVTPSFYCGVIAILWGTAALGSSIGIDIAKEMGVTSPLTQREYSPLKDTQFVTIRPKGGVAQLKGWRVPSLMVWAAKSRTMMVEKAKGSVKGVNVMKP
jgi:hypothetical protein